MALAQRQESVSPKSRPLLGASLRESTRIDFEREVSLSFENLEGFMTEFSVNISTTGMFVRSPEPRPAGTLLSFELALTDGQPLIRGHGEVVWVRRHDGGTEHPAGMGIRFVDLDPESRRLIRWAVVRRCFQDDDHLDLSELTAQAGSGVPLPGSAPNADAASSELRRLYTFAGCAAAQPERRWRPNLRPLLPLAALIVCGLYLVPGTTESAVAPEAAGEVPIVAQVAVPEPTVPASQPPQAAAVPAVAQPAVAVPAPALPIVPVASPPSEPAAPVAAAEPAAAAPEPPPPSRQQLVDVAQAWARAWADQRVDDYLGFYAADFRPPRGMSRGDWQAERRLRIASPRHIEVALGSIAVEPMSSDRARVTFDQAYRSDNYRDSVHKTLELVREKGDWRILAERADG